MNLKKINLIHQNPSSEEYCQLRKAVDWWNVESKVTQKGLENSLHSVCAFLEKKIIGCGRIVGDGGIYFYIQDVIVLPEYQGQGVGKLIMDDIMKYLENHCKEGSFVGLMAAKGVQKFYENYGFSPRPFERPGMFKVYEKLL